jgi:predicted nucleotidyltransferase component of viral defense system
LVEDNLRLASSKEIAAMKMAAIINRGSKKDFIDLNELLKIFTLNQILDFYVQKFSDSSLFFALKSIIFLMMPMSRKCHLCSIILPGKQ